MAHIISQAEVMSMLLYDSATGAFWWRSHGKGRRSYGEPGTVTNKGYRVIMIAGRRYLAHKLAWLFVTGDYPDFEIDHADGDPLNNAIHNLRRSTHSQNLANSKTRSDNFSGQRGVCWDKQKNKWKVQIGPASRRIQKHFDDLFEAVNFAKEKHREIFGEFSRVKE